jgi:hypothetical protein
LPGFSSYALLRVQYFNNINRDLFEKAQAFLPSVLVSYQPLGWQAHAATSLHEKK